MLHGAGPEVASPSMKSTLASPPPSPPRAGREKSDSIDEMECRICRCPEEEDRPLYAPSVSWRYPASRHSLVPTWHSYTLFNTQQVLRARTSLLRVRPTPIAPTVSNEAVYAWATIPMQQPKGYMLPRIPCCW